MLADITRPDQSIIQTVAPVTTEKAAAPLQEPHVSLASLQIPLRYGCTYGTSICITEAREPPHHGKVCGFLRGVVYTKIKKKEDWCY